MTRKTFLDLVAFVRKTDDVELHTDSRIPSGGKDFPWRLRGFAVPDVNDFKKHVTRRNDSPYRYNRNARHGISLTFHPKTPWDIRASVLIHEFGHCQIFRKAKKGVRKNYTPFREELRAWHLGLNSVPCHLLPSEKTFQKVSVGALCTYFGLSKKEIEKNI